MKTTWNIESSVFAKKTFNPIRHIIENLKITPNPEKDMISLSIGDPTVFGNLKPSEVVIQSVIDVLRKGSHNGYAPSTGIEASRQAVAKYCSVPGAELEAKDIILCSGCSSSLDMCITALCSPKQTLLVPRPGFPLYGTLAEGLGVNIKFYDLLPERNWEVDTEMMESLIDETTAAIIINNPSNPCGSVFSKEHLLDILDVAERNKIPIIADEIYADFVFESQEYYPLASLTKEVPILSCGGLTKRWLVPGWRLGWVAIYDRNGIFAQEVRNGLHSLSQRVLGSNTLVQGALPAILENTPQSFFDDTIAVVENNANVTYDLLRQIPGLRPIYPQGAMYMMVAIDLPNFIGIKNDLEFVEKLVAEESVFCLPGKCFHLPNYMRVVLTVPEEQTREACQRIKHFCARHSVFEKESALEKVTTEEIMNANNSSRKARGKRNPFIRGSSYDVLPVDQGMKEKIEPLKKLIKKNSILEMDLEMEQEA